MSPKRHDQEFVQKTWTLALMCAKYCLLDVFIENLKFMVARYEVDL